MGAKTVSRGEFWTRRLYQLGSWMGAKTDDCEMAAWRDYRCNTFHSPLFPGMCGTVDIAFKDSKCDSLIHASDTWQNMGPHYARNGKLDEISGKMFATMFP